MEKCSSWSILVWCSYQPMATSVVAIMLITMSQFLYDWKVVSVSELSRGNEDSSRDWFPTPLPNGILQYFRLSLLQILESADVVSIKRGM